MKIWKDTEDHGRHGDTMMKKIDGDLAHVNAVEYEMSPEYIKETGSGTINPITGKKEYFLPAIGAAIATAAPVLKGISAGISVVGSLFKGFSALGNKDLVAEGKLAAEQQFQDQMDILTGKKDLAHKAAGTATLDLGRGTATAIGGVTRGTETALSRSGMANVQQVTQAGQTGTEDILAGMRSDYTKILDTKEAADLQFRQGEISAIEAREATLAELETVPTKFLEGVFG